jgi:Bacterial Ig domain/Dockerin type I domain
MSRKRRRNHQLQIERLEGRFAPAVFGFDNRTQLGEDNLINPIASFPAPFGDVFAAYPAIGMLVNDANRNGTPDRPEGGGTLFLIGRNWALTAAHCLYLKDANGNVAFNPPDSQLLGFFGWDGTTAHSGVAGVKVRYIPPEWKNINGTFKDGKAFVPHAATRYDWALLELDVNIGDRAKIWFDVLGDPADALKATFSAGHPTDSGPTNGNGPFIGYRPMVATNGPADRVFDGRMVYLPQDYPAGLSVPPYTSNISPHYLRRPGESRESYDAREVQRMNTFGLDTFSGQSGSPIWASQPPDFNVPRLSQYQVYGIVSSGDLSGNNATYLGDNAVSRLKSIFGTRAAGAVNHVADPESDETARPILTSYDRLFDTANDVAASHRMIGEGRVKFFVERFTLYNRGLAAAATSKVSFHLVDASTLAPVDVELATDWDGILGQVSVPPSGPSRQYQFDLFSVAEVPFGQYRVGWKIEQDGAPGFDSGLFPQTISIRPYGIIEGLPEKVQVRYGRESDPIPFTVRTVSGRVEETLQFAREYPDFPDGPFGTQAPKILDPAGFRLTGMGTGRALTFRPIWNADQATGTGSGPTGTTRIYVADYNDHIGNRINVQVLPNEAPLITAPSGLTMNVGQTKSIDITLDVTDSTGRGLLSVLRVTLLPAPGIILSGMGANRTVELSPAAGLTGSATVTLTATDADGLSRTQSFNLEVVTLTVPEADVFNGTTPVVDGGTVAFGSAPLGSPAFVKTLTVKNTGAVPLTMSAATLTGAGFTILNNVPATLAAGASASLVVQLDTTVADAKSAVLSFANNDSNENPYNFTLTGTVFILPTSGPTVGADVIPVRVDGAVTVDVLANDVPKSGTLDRTSARIDTAPRNGTASFDASGNLFYTPNAGFVGTDSFTYAVSDSEGNVTISPAVEVRIVQSGLTNARNFFDVNADDEVTPLDSLLVMNFLRRRGRTNVPVVSSDAASDFVDTDDSLSVTPLDALLVTNFIRRQRSNRSGESIQASANAVDIHRASIASLQQSIFVDNVTSVTPQLVIPSSVDRSDDLTHAVSSVMVDQTAADQVVAELDLELATSSLENDRALSSDLTLGRLSDEVFGDSSLDDWTV